MRLRALSAILSCKPRGRFRWIAPLAAGVAMFLARQLLGNRLRKFTDSRRPQPPQSYVADDGFDGLLLELRRDGRWL
jgi:hypothetical protein